MSHVIRRTPTYILLLVGALLTPSAVSAQIEVEVVFSTQDRQAIRAYYQSHPEPAAEALPPGIRRNLARGKKLPPGIAKKALPPALDGQVSAPEGYETIQVGLDVLLVEAATGIIHDVLMDVVR